MGSSCGGRWGARPRWVGGSRCEHPISCTPGPEAGPAVTAAVRAHGSPVSRRPARGPGVGTSGDRPSGRAPCRPLGRTGCCPRPRVTAASRPRVSVFGKKKTFSPSQEMGHAHTRTLTGLPSPVGTGSLRGSGGLSLRGRRGLGTFPQVGRELRLPELPAGGTFRASSCGRLLSGKLLKLAVE